jgi:hypothetical protein
VLFPIHVLLFHRIVVRLFSTRTSRGRWGLSYIRTLRAAVWTFSQHKCAGFSRMRIPVMAIAFSRTYASVFISASFRISEILEVLCAPIDILTPTLCTGSSSSSFSWSQIRTMFKCTAVLIALQHYGSSAIHSPALHLVPARHQRILSLFLARIFLPHMSVPSQHVIKPMIFSVLFAVLAV